MGLNMARIRTLKPEWLDDEVLVMASVEARLLSVALILMADDHGNGRVGPDRIVSVRVFPLAPESYRKAVCELEAINYVRLYRIDNQEYFSIRTWPKHQRIDNAGKNQVPPPPNLAETRGEIPRTAETRGGSRLDPDPDPDPDRDREADRDREGTGNQNAETRPASHGPARSAPEHVGALAKDFEARAAKMAAKTNQQREGR
jgi:hypothetical protein